jgi:uncharacterized protein
MLIVSNTSPILNLAIIGQLELIRQQFTQISIPPGVAAELKIDEDRPGSEIIRHAIAAEWIQIQPVGQSTGIIRLLRQTLDQGESEAIALAIEIGADLLLLDERDARKAAKSLGLEVTGVLGILLKAKQTGSLVKLEPVLKDLEQIAGFRISLNLLSQLLAADNQNSE